MVVVCELTAVAVEEPLERLAVNVPPPNERVTLEEVPVHWIVQLMAAEAVLWKTNTVQNTRATVSITLKIRFVDLVIAKSSLNYIHQSLLPTLLVKRRPFV